GNSRAFSGVRIANDPHGRASPRFRTSERGVPEEPTAEPPVERPQSAHEARNDGIGQNLVQIGRSRASAIAGRDLSPARLAGEKITGPLKGGLIGSTGRQVSEALNALLVMDARQGMRTACFSRFDRDNQPAVSKGGIAPALAHSVSTEIPGIAH